MSRHIEITNGDNDLDVVIWVDYGMGDVAWQTLHPKEMVEVHCTTKGVYPKMGAEEVSARNQKNAIVRMDAERSSTGEGYSIDEVVARRARRLAGIAANA